MSGQLPPQIQNQLAQLQQLQQQGQALVNQKNQIEVLKKETESALNELDNASEDVVVYKNVGEIFLKADRATLLEELKERKDLLELRLKTVTKQEERIQGRFAQLQEQLKQALGQVPPKGG